MTTQTLPARRLDYKAYSSLDAVNWSTLCYAVDSAAAYAHCLTQETPETDPMRLGRAVHAAVFEPEVYEAEFVVWDGGTRRGGAWEEFKSASLTKTIIRASDVPTVEGIQRAVRSHPVARLLLECGEAEVTITWEDAKTGLACKARLDWLCPLVMADLKSTRDVEQHAFGRHAAGMRYHGQLAFYDMGLKANDMQRAVKIIAVQSAPPFEVAVFDVDEDALWAGEVLVSRALALVAECRKRREWPGRYTREVPLALPGWAFPSEQQTDEVLAGRYALPFPDATEGDRDTRYGEEAPF